MVKKLRKQYDTPTEGWSEERIQKEDQLIEDYGLKNKREVYKAESMLRSLRRGARKLVAEEDETQKKELLNRVHKLGLIKSDAKLEEILTLKTTDILDRRLQSAVSRKGFADTPMEARQLVTHGHIYINGKRVNIPSYILTQEEEKEIELRLPEPEQTEEEEVEEAEEAEDTEETDSEDKEEAEE